MCRTVHIYTGDLRTILVDYNSNYMRYFLIQRVLKIQCLYASFFVETCRDIFKLSAESEILFGKSFPYRPRTHRRFLLRFLDKSLSLVMQQHVLVAQHLPCPSRPNCSFCRPFSRINPTLTPSSLELLCFSFPADPCCVSPIRPTPR